MANIKARRLLSDLYKRGVEVRFGRDPDGKPKGSIAPGGEGYFVDDDGKPIPVKAGEIQLWVQSPSPLHREMAMRDAQAARARALVKAKRDENSEEHLTIMAFLADMSDETLVDYVLLQRDQDRRADAMREVLAEDEWKDMTSYQDAMRQYEADERPQEELDNDPEYAALMELDLKFGEQVRARENELLEAERQALSMRSRGDLEKKALDKRAEVVGTQAFMAEYEKQMLFYSVRDFEDTGVMFFESARELAASADEIRTTIQEAMVPFISDVTEAKNSPGAASGSTSSEPPSEPETSAASTPEPANA
jgi:hypothetical protein